MKKLLIALLLLPCFIQAQMFGSLSADDPDAYAVISSGSITATNSRDALNTLAKDLKAYMLWGKMKAVYPLSGTTSTSKAINLKTPGTFNLTFTGALVYTNAVYLVLCNDGVSGYASTGITPSTHLTDNNMHLSFYSTNPTNTNVNLVDIGAENGGQTNGFFMHIRYNDGNVYGTAYHYGLTGESVETTGGYAYTILSRTASNSLELYGNGTSIATNTGTSTSSNTSEAEIRLGYVTYASSLRQVSLATIGDGLNDTEAAIMYTITNKFTTNK